MPALSCSTADLDYGTFEFIDCSTISVSYNVRGVANISFTVLSSSDELLNDYTNLTFGNVNFIGYVSNVSVSKITGTLINQFQLQLTAFGC